MAGFKPLSLPSFFTIQIYFLRQLKRKLCLIFAGVYYLASVVQCKDLRNISGS